MTLAAQLALLICGGVLPVPGEVHDPSQPLVLGDVSTNNYTVITYDASQKRTTIQAVSQTPGQGVVQSTLTFSSAGTLLINGQSILNTSEFQTLLAAAQAAADAAAQAAADAQAAQDNAESAATVAGENANDASASADLALSYAQAPEGTDLPGGGNSAAVSAVVAAQIAQESRDLEIGDDITASETFQSGFLFTERQAIPAGGATLVVTVPPGIFSSGERRARWASYRLRASGGVQFVGAAGGSNLVTPTVLQRGRSAYRVANTGVGLYNTLMVPVSYPAVTDGELVMVFHAHHQGTDPTKNALSMNFTEDAPFAFTTLRAYPTVPRAVASPDYFVVRAPLVGVSAGSFTAQFLEGENVHFQACDWWVLEGTSGAAPVHATSGLPANVQRNYIQTTLPGLAAQSLVLATAGAGLSPAGDGAGAYQSMSSNLSRVASGKTDGIDDAAVSNTNYYKNSTWAIGQGVANVAGDFTGQVNWDTATLRPNMLMLGYAPKSVVGGGTVNMNYEGGRDTLTVLNGVAELWFQRDGVTVDVRTPKP